LAKFCDLHQGGAQAERKIEGLCAKNPCRLPGGGRQDGGKNDRGTRGKIFVGGSQGKRLGITLGGAGMGGGLGRESLGHKTEAKGRFTREDLMSEKDY